jgi:hypothetical protein
MDNASFLTKVPKVLQSTLDDKGGTVSALKMDEVVCAHNFFKRKGAKPILQATVHCSQVSGKFDSGQRSMYRFQVEQSVSLEINVPMFLVPSSLEIFTFFFFTPFQSENQMKTLANARRDEICC